MHALPLLRVRQQVVDAALDPRAPARLREGAEQAVPELLERPLERLLIRAIALEEQGLERALVPERLADRPGEEPDGLGPHPSVVEALEEAGVLLWMIAPQRAGRLGAEPLHDALDAFAYGGGVAEGERCAQKRRDLAIPLAFIRMSDPERVGGQIGVVVGAGERVELVFEKGQVFGLERH